MSRSVPSPHLDWVLLVGLSRLKIGLHALSVALCDDLSIKVHTCLPSIQAMYISQEHDAVKRHLTAAEGGPYATVDEVVQPLKQGNLITHLLSAFGIEHDVTQPAGEPHTGTRSIQQFNDQFFGLMPLPAIAGCYHDDAVFAAMRVGGPHPLHITCVSALTLPSRSPSCTLPRPLPCMHC